MEENLKITFEQLMEFARQSRFSNPDFAADADDESASNEDTVDLTNTGTFDPLPTVDRTIDIWDLLDDDKQ